MSHNRHPYSSPDNFGGGVHHTRSQKATIRAFDKFYSWFPSFLDMFPDEEAFVNFVSKASYSISLFGDGVMIVCYASLGSMKHGIDSVEIEVGFGFESRVL